MSTDLIMRALAGVMAALERATLAGPAAKTDEAKVAMYQRCFHEIVTALNLLDDAELYSLWRIVP